MQPGAFNAVLPAETSAADATSSGAASSGAASAGAASRRPLANPSLHVDLALNLVVLEFVNDKGDVTSSIPSEKQLKAYRDQDAGAGDVVGLSISE